MSSLNDSIGGANLYGGTSWTYTYDRFGNPNQAILFSSGFLQAPPGIYFQGEFTFIAWVFWKGLISWSGIIDFGNGWASDNVIIGLESTGQFFGAIIAQGNNWPQYFCGNAIMPLISQWYHTAVVLQGTTLNFYLNGFLVAYQQVNFAPTAINRTNNFIGRSEVNNYNIYAIIDDIKIYQGAMSSAQILNDYQVSSNG